MIESLHNRWVKDIRRSRGSKGDAILLEGPHLVAEAIAGGLELRAVLATPELLADDRLDIPWPRPPLLISPALLDQITDADSPRGVVALADRPQSNLHELSQANDPAARSVYVVAAGLQDPGNLGALARTAEASGARALLTLRGTVSPWHPRALRASAGSLLRLPTFPGLGLTEVYTALAASQATWYKLVPRGGRSPYRDEPHVEGARVLLVGAEGPGLPAEANAINGVELTIPMHSEVESLNANVAAAVVLFEWSRQAATKRT